MLKFKLITTTILLSLTVVLGACSQFDCGCGTSSSSNKSCQCAGKSAGCK